MIKMDLYNQLAKIKAMRGQCLEAREKISSTMDMLHSHSQDDAEAMMKPAAREKKNADTAYEGFLQNRAYVGKPNT